MNKRTLIVLIAVTVLFGGLFGMKWFGGKKMNEFFDNMPVPPATVTSFDVAELAWPNTIDAVGSIVAVQGVNVTTQITGQVEKLHFESGQRVKAGDVLITLDGSTEKAELRNLEAQAQLRDVALRRQQKLFGLQSVARSAIDQAEADAASARAQVEAQKAQIAKKTIRAPFAGELGIRRVNLGQYLEPGTNIVSLQSLDPVYVDFSLPEQRLGQVLPGLATELSVDAFPGRHFAGTVLAVEPEIDAATRSFIVRAKVPNPQGQLRAGGFTRVAVALPGERRVIAVPRTAVAYSAYGNAAFVIHQAKPGAKPAAASADADQAVKAQPQLIVRQRFIRTGETRGDFVEVLDGLKVGDAIASSGLFRLNNDVVVNINNSVEPKAELNPTGGDS